MQELREISRLVHAGWYRVVKVKSEEIREAGRESAT
jgi:hypothetical protein